MWAVSQPRENRQNSIRRWYASDLSQALHTREFGHRKPRSSIRSLYGHSRWIDSLDIVNELTGHSGCVNALSWSKSGRLLASGSDDKHVNIYRYQPDDSSAQFSLATTVATGHTANIFSVKFMPHSNDHTLVSAAGDSQVRVFDLEHQSASNVSATAADMVASAHRGRRGVLYNGVRFLTDDNTGCRVYRSHGERVKRIVTESSPHLFLTCSEDGEVRQWDLRQPSSAYPAPRFGSRGSSDVPPPLISYKRYGLDLNTISCSPSQPHYIALGGASPYCLLHDRRMIATPDSSRIETGASFGRATRCVRKFSPNGQQRRRRADSGHITACKISDANPNEMIVSWSGDNIYSFDLLRTPDAEDKDSRKSTISADLRSNKLKQEKFSDRKRRRNDSSTSHCSQPGTQRVGSRQKTEEAQTPGGAGEDQEMALRVQYANGQTEEIPLQQGAGETLEGIDWTDAFRDHDQRSAHDLARRAMKLRSTLLESRSDKTGSSKDPTGHGTYFTTILGFCVSTLPEMKQIHASWSYAVEPSQYELTFQRRLRAGRESCIRFVQAAGVVARVLGGRIQSASGADSSIAMFEKIHVLSTEGPDLASEEQFRYDFLKAIFLWLDSGVGALLEGFSSANGPAGRTAKRRFPVPADADTEAVDEFLVPYFLELLGDSDTDDDEDEDDENDEDGDEDEDEDDDDNDTDDIENDNEDTDHEGDEEFGGLPRRIYRSAFKPAGLRSKVEANVPCAASTRVYKGHCNVQTVKDVNFYGLDDEYVVSGSDDGNLFIWDRKSTKLVNILEGDGEVVNVVQGHPYEPMLAVSGIDDTVKIFSADARSRMAARLGSGVEAADSSSFSSINWPSRAYGRRESRQSNRATTTSDADDALTMTEQADERQDDNDNDDDDFVASNGLASRKRLQREYQITSENDSRRQNGGSETFVTIEDILALFFRRAG
ncbi:hypothetical protein ANO11243_005990 [Dothideomycetidae sp. 11243]|nr:hypothetical protein ANO11243_005990 [fungal sp. No.11243]